VFHKILEIIDSYREHEKTDSKSHDDYDVIKRGKMLLKNANLLLLTSFVENGIFRGHFVSL